jgi:hypothetical protein
VSGRAVLLLVLATRAAGAQEEAPNLKRAAIGRLISAVEYGVPESPAFELLPDRPSEVVQVVTPKDFKSALSSWRDGSTVRVGAALDARPLVRQGGSLAQYQGSWWRQAAFRSVLSAGSAAAVVGSSDVVVAAGLRIPVIDKGDPRADAALVERLAQAYNRALEAQGPPPFDATTETFVARSAQASMALDTIREAYGRTHWNALKVEIGVAASAQASSGRIARDSIQPGRVGLWGALAVPVLRFGQATVAGKSMWPHTETPTEETNRSILGGRLRLFPTEQLSLSGEYSRVWSDHGNASNLNQQWNHLALAAEWYVPELKGWLGVAYGGNTSRPSNNEDQLSLSYAIYHQRLLEPK